MGSSLSGIDTTKTNTNDIHNQGMSREDAYKLGVKEVYTDHPTVFIDPDKIRNRAPGPPGKSFRSRGNAAAQSLERQMERQSEGSTAALKAKFEEDGDSVSVIEIARALKKQDPAALSDLDVHGHEHGIAIVPRYSVDSKRELTNLFTGHFDRSVRRDVYDNMPGTSQDWMRLVGNHEGAHLTKDLPTETNLQTMIEEVRADRIAIQMAKDRGQDDIALAFKDLRALAGGVDPTHSSAPLTNSNDPVTDMHLETAWSFRWKTDEVVDDNFNWDTYGGSAETPEELLKENPRAYFSTAQKTLDELEAKVVSNYEADPSLDNQKAVFEAQLMIGYQKNFEDAYRRRVLGEDVPERAPIQLFSQEAEDGYLASLEDHARVLDTEAQIGEIGYQDEEFFAGDLLMEYDWSSHPDGVEGPSDLTRIEQYDLALEIMEGKKAEVLEDFENNPSLDTLKRVMTLEKAMDITRLHIAQIHAIENNTDFPMTVEPTQLISESEREAALLAHANEQDRLQAIEFEIGDASYDHYVEASKGYTEDKVFEGYDWDAHEGAATTPFELHEENPEAYRQQEVVYLENMKQEALDAYAQDPSYENTGKLLEAQHITGDIYKAINIERMDDGLIPPLAILDTEEFVPEDVKVEYYRERMAREQSAEMTTDAEQEAENAQTTPEDTPNNEPSGRNNDNSGGDQNNLSSSETDKGYEQGVDGTAYTTEVTMEAAGEPNVDFESGVSVGDTPITEFFGQNAAPESSDVTVVHATSPDVDIAPEVAALAQETENTQSLQTLG